MAWPHSIGSITVFCSSSDEVAPVFTQSASELGRAIAGQNWTLVYGGNALGMMKALSNGCRGAGGKVIGITPSLFIDQNCLDPHCDELVVTQTMRERKAAMEARGDAFIALPGGLGTLEEFFEILGAKQLGYHDKPIILLNIDRFYDPLLSMIAHGLEHRFIRPRANGLFHVAASVADAIAHLRQCPSIDGSASRRLEPSSM